MRDSDETRRLLEQARAEEAGAVDRLLQRHRPYLRQLAALRLDPRVQARVDPSDVVQEAQLEASRRLRDYLDKPAMPFRLWLRQIAYDRLVMLQRAHLRAGKRSVRREVGLPDDSTLLLARQLFAAQPKPSDDLAKDELMRRVRDAVARLGDDDREILLLRNFEGLTNQEAARVLDLNPVAASKRYGRALLRLRHLLVDEG